MIKIAVVGATGYTGGELLRLLSQHPKVEVRCVTSHQSAGKPLVSRLPFLNGHYDLILESLDVEKIAGQSDLIFIALSHTQAMGPVNQFLDLGKKVIDLSADFRLQSTTTYETWYGVSHTAPELLNQRVYGLSEIYRNQIKKTNLVANPGCYPTGTLLPIFPFLKKGLVDFDREIIIDAKSGVSGAGRAASSKTHFPEVNEGLLPYNIGSHRHLPEINQEITHFGGKTPQTLFTPYLLPVNRGILTTIYLPLNQALNQQDIHSVLEVYKNEPFIRLYSQAPNISAVRGTNYCDIAAFETPAQKTVILISTIDNLVKGAAGQAIQNMNLIMGWEESLGLSAPGLFP